jgi:hypothetical protein
VGKLGLSDLVVPQGRTVLVYVHANQPVTATGTLGDTALNFVAQGGGEWVAPAGIGARAEIGAVPVHVALTGRDGRQVAFETEVQVVSGGYESETLYLTPEIGQLLVPRYTAQAEHLRAIYGASRRRCSGR